MQRGLSDPLAAVKVVNQLASACGGSKTSLYVSNDMTEFYHVRKNAREEPPSPMFDATTDNLSCKSFWIGLKNENHEFVGLQACRLDPVDTSLADWGVAWMSGLYMKRNILMVPESLSPPTNSSAYKLRGKLVYHGELWLDDSVRKQPLLADAFCFTGMVLAHLKWQPDGIWALVTNKMATLGFPTRFGYLRQERSFFRWKVSPRDVPPNEWLLLLDFNDMEHLIKERAEEGLIIKGA